MKRFKIYKTLLIHDDRGFNLVEVLIAAVVFTSVFLLLFTLLGKMLITFSGSDFIRISQIADQYLAEFQVSGKYPKLPKTVVRDNIHYIVEASVKNIDNLTKLTLTIKRTNDDKMIEYFYAEKFNVEY